MDTNNKLLLLAPGLLDQKLIPFASKAIALATIPKWQREIGQQVNIIENGEVLVYQFKEGVTDADLVPLVSIETDGITIIGAGTVGDPVTGLLPFQELTITSSATTWDLSTGINKKVSASANFTLTISNPISGMCGILTINATAGLTITLDTGLVYTLFEGSLTLTAGIYVLALIYNGDFMAINILNYPEL